MFWCGKIDTFRALFVPMDVSKGRPKKSYIYILLYYIFRQFFPLMKESVFFCLVLQGVYPPHPL